MDNLRLARARKILITFFGNIELEAVWFNYSFYALRAICTGTSRVGVGWVTTFSARLILKKCVLLVLNFLCHLLLLSLKKEKKRECRTKIAGAVSTGGLNFHHC